MWIYMYSTINDALQLKNEYWTISKSMTLCLKDKLEELEKKLEEVFHSSEEDVEIAEGQVCVAYVDELYHRVRVIKKEPLKVDKLLTFFFTLNIFCFNQYMFTID